MDGEEAREWAAERTVLHVPRMASGEGALRNPSPEGPRERGVIQPGGVTQPACLRPQSAHLAEIGEAFKRLGTGALSGPTVEARQLFTRAGPFIYEFVHRALRHHRPANREIEDLAQDVFVRVWKHREGYRGASEGELKGWIRQICRNEVLRSSRPVPATLRTRPIRNEESETGECFDESSDAQPPSLWEERSQTFAALEACFAELPEDQRQAITLLYFVGLTQRQAAVIMECSTGRVHNLKKQGLDRLQDCMKSRDVT